MMTRRELFRRFAGAIIGKAVSPAITATPIGYVGGAVVGHLRAKPSPFTFTSDPVMGITLRFQRDLRGLAPIRYGRPGTQVLTATIPERYLYDPRGVRG